MWGDQQQLPPTSFFDRMVDDDDNDEDDDEGAAASASDMESILTLFEARGVNKRMLSWHYRSRDPSLIRVSNAEFYDDGLVLPPSPLQLDDGYGLKLRRVAGVYAPKNSGLGRAGTNRIEAEEIARAVAAHARRHPDLSLGVVAFSKAQSDMITEVLENARRTDSVLDRFLQTGASEEFFVKNIENVQGDERDVIMISVGYGPQVAGGRLTSMGFGPINGEGGGRRLNVLFSRARTRCEVFTSFDPADIDPGRASRDGLRILKRFLDFAKTGSWTRNPRPGSAPTAPSRRMWQRSSALSASRQIRRSAPRASGSTSACVIQTGRPTIFSRGRMRRRGLPFRAVGARARPAASGGSGVARLALPPHLEHRLVSPARPGDCTAARHIERCADAVTPGRHGPQHP